MLFLKSIKTLAIGAGALALGGGVLFGTDLGSYMTSSARSVRTAVKDTIPVEVGSPGTELEFAL